MDDPHMYYYIQSPHKIEQLLKSYRFYLDNDRLVEVASNKSVPIDPYVLHRIHMPEQGKFTQSVINKLTEKNNHDKENSRNESKSSNNSMGSKKVKRDST